MDWELALVVQNTGPPKNALADRSAELPEQPITSHPLPVAIQVAVPLPQQLLGPCIGADLLASDLDPAGLGSLRVNDGRA